MRNRILVLAVCMAITVVMAVGAADNILFILDSSNSMNKTLGDDSRMNVAKAALSDLLFAIPDGQALGLLVFGHRMGHDNQVESCKDIELLYSVDALSSTRREQMLSALPAIIAQGMTPLADSLVAAANELARLQGTGTIVLISDGEGTCGGQHDVVAAMLSTMDPPIRLHVIGLDIEPDARQTLTSMALATGGQYWAVQEASGLLQALLSALEATEADVTSPQGIPTWALQLGITNMIVGTEGDDVLYGTSGNDLILGLGGNDFLIGLGGNDILVGGDGDDILEGMDGNDILIGGPGNDILLGGSGDDILCGGTGDDSLEGEAGNDVLDGGPGYDKLLGGSGKNLLYSADGTDLLLEGEIVIGCSPQCMDIEALLAGATTCLPAPRPQDCPVPSSPADSCLLGSIPPKSECAPPADIKTVREGERLQLHGSILDYECNVEAILWEVSAGELDDPRSLDPVFFAPMLDGCDDLDVHVVLTAVDRCGSSGSDSFVLRVLNVNHAPTVDAGPDRSMDEGTALLLQPTLRDPDCDVLSVTWTVLGPHGTIESPSGGNATFVAPWIDVCDGIDVTLRVDVVDPCGASACDFITIHVRNVNHTPVVDLGPDFSINEGLAIRMQPVVHDPDCDELTYCWTVTRGTLSNPIAANPTFTAPMTACCDGEYVTMTLTVTDPCGLSATDSVRIHVADVNAAPYVNLGPDLCVIECQSILLTPSVGDPDCDPLTYVWTVSRGALDRYDAAAAVFTAPATDICDGEYVTITLTVTDPCGLSATDSIVVRVENVNTPPRVHADP
jgi:hypothetical protein